MGEVLISIGIVLVTCALRRWQNEQQKEHRKRRRIFYFWRGTKEYIVVGDEELCIEGEEDVFPIPIDNASIKFFADVMSALKDARHIVRGVRKKEGLGEILFRKKVLPD